MVPTKVSAGRASTAILATTALLWLGVATSRGQETQKEEQEARKEVEEKKEPASPKVEKRDYRLTVVVVATDSESPVNSASVTVFYGEEIQNKATNGDGRASFRFTTEAKTATVRITAAKLNPYQRSVGLTSGEIEHRAALTKSN